MQFIFKINTQQSTGKIKQSCGSRFASKVSLQQIHI